MAFHDELLWQASELAHKTTPNQADLRRSVSAAYYALFHLLIFETTLHWSLDSSRSALGRMFEHGVMRRVSNRTANPNIFPFEGQDPETVQSLRTVARNFVNLQDKRHIADYDNGRVWTFIEALTEVQQASLAFDLWRSISSAQIAQDYLVSLLIKPRD